MELDGLQEGLMEVMFELCLRVVKDNRVNQSERMALEKEKLCKGPANSSLLSISVKHCDERSAGEGSMSQITEGYGYCANEHETCA